MTTKIATAAPRRKFLRWGGLSALTLLTGVSIRKIFTAKNKANPEEIAAVKTVKMLTQDGRLVEIPVSQLPTSKTKITDAAVHDWVKL